MVDTRTIESFTMIPDIPMIPTMENIDKGTPQYQCPKIAPTSPKGMTDITTKGRAQLAKTQARHR